MKLPWQKRADGERRERVHAENRLRETEQDWTPVHAAVAKVRRERELNGWTAAITTIFEGGHQ